VTPKRLHDADSSIGPGAILAALLGLSLAVAAYLLG